MLFKASWLNLILGIVQWIYLQLNRKKLMIMNLNFQIIGGLHISRVLQKTSHLNNTKFLNLRC